jgi:flagellar protein FliL
MRAALAAKGFFGPYVRRPAKDADRARHILPAMNGSLTLLVVLLRSRISRKVFPMSTPAPVAEEGAPKKKMAGKTLVLFIILPALLVVGGGGAAAMMLMGGGGQSEAHGEKEAKGGEHKEEKKEEGKGGDHGGEGGKGAALKVSSGEGVTNVALPEMLVNMATDDGRPALLKLKVTIEAKDSDVVDALESRLPRVMDQFQGFLRELRIDDLSGSAGSARLRLELLRRVNLAIAPAEAHAVLIEEMLVQ